MHPYTFRAENTFLPTNFRSDLGSGDYGRGVDEMLFFLRLGVDGLFTDVTDVGVLAREIFEAEASLTKQQTNSN